MANTKAEISNIDLEGGKLNLDDEQIQITSYEGYNRKNSLFLGGQLKNWYKREFHPGLPIENAKVIQKWREHVVWQDGTGGIFIDDQFINSFITKGIEITDFTDSWIPLPDITGTYSDLSFRITGDILKIKFTYANAVVNQEIVLAGLHSLNVGVINNTLYVTLYNRNTFLTMHYNTTAAIFVGPDNVVVYQGLSGPVLLTPLTGSGRFSYDSVCQTHDTATTHECVGAATVQFTFQEIIDKVGDNTSTSGGWSRGRKVKTAFADGNLNVYVLYYNYEQTGISINNSIIANNIDSVITIQRGLMYYKDAEGRIKRIRIIDTPYLECQSIIKDRYLLINTISYKNTIDLETGSVFCRSDDFNDRAIVNLTNAGGSMRFVVSSWGEQVETMQFSEFATVYPPRIQKGDAIDSVRLYGDARLLHDVNIYMGDRDGFVTPIYKNSYDLSLNQAKTNFDLDGRYYPMNNFPLYNVSIIAKFNDIYLNYALVDEGGFSFITQIDQYQNMIFGYYPTTYITLNNMFVLQGSIYGINRQYIVALNVQNASIQGAVAVCNKSDMIYIGATPKAALFYSPMDKSIYLFTGDQAMTKFYDCNRINTIYSFYNNPATGFILIATDAGIIGIYNNQVFALDDIEYTGNIYYADGSYCIGNIEYTPYKKNDFELVPIILETKFYGSSIGTKSVNDCVYIRLFSENREASGTVKVWCETLNEGSKKSNEKVFYIDKSMFDPATQSMYIRYQPMFQEATGFRVHVESDFSICTMSISHSTSAIQNAKYNL